MDSGGTLNTKILESFVTFLTVGRTQNFDIGIRKLQPVEFRVTLRVTFFRFDLTSSLFSICSSKFLESFVTFLTVGRTQNFDIGIRKLRLVEFGVTLRVTFFRFELTSSLFSICSSKFNSIVHMHMQNIQQVGPIRSSLKEKFDQYIRRTYNRW
jgi:hypothetical protein